MDRKRTRVRAGLVGLAVAALLGATACGGDGSDGASGPGDAGQAGDPAGGRSSDGGDGGDGVGAAGDPCGLLQVAEIEAQFGTAGPVHEGRSQEGGSPEGLDAVSCVWEVGDTPDDLSQVNLSILVDAEASGAEFLATRREDATDPVDVPSLGEGAFLDFSGVYFLAGDTAVQISAFLPPPGMEGAQDKFVALGQLVLQRL